MIVCSECGRAISDKAALCVGCGAPVERPIVARVPEAPARPAPLNAVATIRQLVLAVAITVAGVVAAMRAERLPGSGRLLSLAAALLLIVGISWALVSAVRLLAGSKP
jgi:hypothetical protein